ncbi:MAG: IS21 family transposase, partial [Candidatus Dormibacteria bacterium]
MPKVELYEAIRKDHEQGLRAIQALAKKHGCHRREVRRALLSALPPAPKVPVRERPVMGPWVVEIDGILEADRKAPRKQRHTARRIWVRLRKEHEAKVAESTVREYVRERRREIFAVPEAMVPQHHNPGKEADVDLQESWVVFPWGEEKVNFFEMRARCSGAPFHWPLQRATQQAFLEAHNRAFAHYGGCFEKVWYDNLTLAVRKVLKGRTRLETENFKLLRSHYLFDSKFCIPGIQGAHEKGGVEGECGYFRRNHLVPVPRVSGWAELEQLCLDAAEEELQRHLDRHERTVGEEWEQERPHLRPLPAEAMDFGLRARCRVDEKSRVNVSCNRYSVPVELVGRWLVAVSSSTEVVVENQGKEV